MKADRNEAGIEALRIAAHDLKNPLTTIKTLAQIFKINLDKGTLVTEISRTSRNCDLLLQQVDKLTVMTDILIDTSRVQSGRMRFEFVPLDLRLVVNSAIVQNQNRVTAVNLPTATITVKADLARLIQAFSALLSVSKAVQVSMAPESDEKWVKVTIVGEFEYAATKEDDPLLYIAQNIIEIHGGEMTDLFQIRLPLYFA